MHNMPEELQEAEAVRRFEAYVRSVPRNRKIELTINRLYDIISPRSRSSLAYILNELVSSGLLHRIVRIESPVTGGGIADYESITDVPDTIHDIYSDVDIHVNPENIRVLYELDQDA